MSTHVIEPLKIELVRDSILNITTDSSIWEGTYRQAALRACDVALQLTGASFVSVWQWDPEYGQLARVCESVYDTGAASKQAGFIDAKAYPRYISALQTHRVMTVEDVLTDVRTCEFADDYSKPKGLVSLLDVTIRRKGQLDGVLCVEQAGTPKTWSMEEIALIVDLADLLGQLALFNESRGTQQLQVALQEVSRKLTSVATVQEVINLALDSVQQQHPEFWFGFFVPDELMLYGHLRGLRTGPDAQPDVKSAEVIPLSQSMTGLAMRQQQLVYIHDFDDPEVREALPTLNRAFFHGHRCGASVPLVHGGRALGCLTVWAGDRDFLHREELNALSVIATSFSGALAHAMQLQELQERAFIDDSSGLANYVQLREDLKLCDPAIGWDLAVVRIRDYARVIGTIGRANARSVVQQLAHRMLYTGINPPGRAYRVNEDELAYLLPAPAGKTGADAPIDVPGWLVGLQADLHRPLQINGVAMGIRVRAGLARYPLHAGNADELLHRAESAVQAAGDSHQQVCVYDRASDTTNTNQLSLIAELDLALTNGTLELHYQPKVQIGQRTLIGAEALLRWNHPTLGQIAPDRIVAVAEAAELIDRLTDWVAKEALIAVKVLHAQGMMIHIAINISANNLLDEEFAFRLESLLLGHSIAPQYLRLELTETALLQDTARALAVIERLVRMGVALEIDDFGTGHSSLSHLRRLPLSTVKLDRSFVKDICSNARDSHIVASVIALAHGLGMGTVAEGVEDIQTMAHLEALGCTTAQGYYIARPMPLAQFMQWRYQARP